MFGYIRIFSIIGLLFTVGAAYGVGVYYKKFASYDLEKLVQAHANTLVHGYVVTTWDTHKNSLLRLNRIAVDEWKKYREYHAFKHDTAQFFDDVNIHNVRIYQKNGTKILQLGELENRNASEKLNAGYLPFEQAKNNASSSEIIENVHVYDTSQHDNNGTIIRVYIPIPITNNISVFTHQTDATVDAVLQLEINITDEWKQLLQHQKMAVFGIIGIFVFLLISLVFFSRRAESIIAKQHEINLELTAAAAAAESENRDKSMFLANISHELRTPLNAIIGFSEILGNELGTMLEHQHKEYIRDINGSGKHLLSLINDILEFSKAEAGKLDIDLSEIDGCKMVKNSVRLMIPRAEEGQITLVEDLPKKPFIMTTDAKKIKQVLLNLLSNSVKFTPPNGQVKISAWQEPVRERVIFVVSDTGIGIAPKDISKVMAAFGQVESDMSRRYEGTGLGLPLSKRLVELMGGTFIIESEEGVGTTITLDMPLHLTHDKIKD